jgi:predicted negative regulator of RcsB-dependent stress response
MVENLEPQFAEDEDLERAKKFWKENGRSITAGVVLGLGAIVGYNGWQSWQQSQGENASTLFGNMTDPSVTHEAAAGLAEDLKQDYGGSPYASHGAFLMAKREVEAGQLEGASAQLNWVLENAKEEGVRHLARIRLSMLLLAQEDARGVLELLKDVDGGNTGGEFAARYYEIAGDAHAQLGDLDAAKGAYESSQALQLAGSSTAELLKLKIENLGKL